MASRVCRPRASSSLTEHSDDELMRVLKDGGHEAFAVLVERHAKRVVRLCSRLAKDPQLGRELAQDTWVLVWLARDKYRGDGSFASWLFTIARNHCRNRARRRELTASETIEALFAKPRNCPEQLDNLLLDERRRRVRRALEQLPFPMREALLLRYAEELRYDQMTTIVSTSERTLRSRVHHGLKLLKRELRKDH
jgi:RNA polymerase sigma-70 factor, ECF subfamily